MLVISLVEKIVEDLNFHRTGLTLLRRKARKNLNGLSLKSRPPNNFWMPGYCEVIIDGIRIKKKKKNILIIHDFVLHKTNSKTLLQSAAEEAIADRSSIVGQWQVLSTLIKTTKTNKHLTKKTKNKTKTKKVLLLPVPFQDHH